MVSTKQQQLIHLLLLNAESLFTVAIAFIFLNERCAKKEYIGILMLLVGVIFVTTNGAFQNLSLSENILGNLLIVGACFFWGIDNNLSKFLSRKRDIHTGNWSKMFHRRFSLTRNIVPSWVQFQPFR